MDYGYGYKMNWINWKNEYKNGLKSNGIMVWEIG